MYKVVIVDDEPWILKSLQETIPWEKWGFVVTGSYMRAGEALKQITQEHVDVVFTDIRMPGLSGIELIQKLREQGLGTEVVVVSGFNHFTYAQQALRLGAFDYCLKPIEDEAIQALLPRLKERLDSKAQQQRLLLCEWVLDPEKPVPDMFLPYPNGPYRAFALESSFVERGRRVLEELTRENTIDFYVGPKYYVIVSMPHMEEEELACHMSDIWIGISAEAQDIRKIPELVRQAGISHAQWFIEKREKPYFYRDSRFEQQLPAVRRAIQLIEEARLMELQEFLFSIPERFAGQGYTMQDLAFVWNQIIIGATDLMKEQIQWSELCISEWQQFLLRYADIDEVCAALYEGLRQCITCTSMAMSDKESESNFAKMIWYLNQHYNEQIKLKDLAEQFYVNKTYACYLFKKNVGVSYSEYLNGMRVAKAKELLAKTSLTVAEISEKVGYADCFYFSKLFKKQIGVNPTQYRKQPWNKAGENL